MHSYQNILNISALVISMFCLQLDSMYQHLLSKPVRRLAVTSTVYINIPQLKCVFIVLIQLIVRYLVPMKK